MIALRIFCCPDAALSQFSTWPPESHSSSHTLNGQFSHIFFFFVCQFLWFSLLLKNKKPCNPFIVIKLYLCIEWKVIKYSLSILLHAHVQHSRYLPSRMLACNYLNLHYDSHCIHFCCADVIRLSKSIFSVQFYCIYFVQKIYFIICVNTIPLILGTQRMLISFIDFNFFIICSDEFFVRHLNAMNGYLCLVSDSNRLRRIFVELFPFALIVGFTPLKWLIWHWIFSLDMANDIREQIDFYLPAEEKKHSMKQSNTNGSPVTSFTTK